MFRQLELGQKIRKGTAKKRRLLEEQVLSNINVSKFIKVHAQIFPDFLEKIFIFSNNQKIEISKKVF